MKDQILALTVVAGAIAVGWVVVRFAMPDQGRKRRGRRSEDGSSGGADYVGDSDDGGNHGWFGWHGHSGDHGGGGDAGAGESGGGGDSGGGGGGD